MLTNFSTAKIRELDRLHSAQGDISARRTPKKIFTRGRGHFLYDSDDVAHLDFQLCNGAAPFGYSSHEHIQAAETQYRELSSLSSEFLSPQRTNLTAALSGSFENSFGAAGRVHFSVGGAQAVDDALKLCARATGKSRVLAMEGGYHGRTVAASSISASYRYRSGFGHVRAAELVPFPYCHRCPFGMTPDDCEMYCVAQVERLFESEACGLVDGAGNADIGAIFVESVLGRGGHVAMPPSYLRGLRKLADQHRMLLVIDDIQMGFMRTGRMWTTEHADVTPDVVLFGKAITNGMFPVSGFWARNDIADDRAWPVGSSHATFSASPVGMALGLTTLNLLSDPTLRTRMKAIGDSIEAILNDFRRAFPYIRAVNRKGLAISLDIQDPSTGKPSPKLAKIIVEQALEAPHEGKDGLVGLVSTLGGMHGHMVMFAPPYRTSDAEITLFQDILSTTLSSVSASR